MAKTTTGTASAQDLSGKYSVAGYTGRSLVRLDGLTLSINDTKRTTLAYGDAARYVTISRGVRTDYAGNVYGADGSATAEATADLDGCQFQDRASRVRYCIAQTTAGFTVAPVTKTGTGL